MVTNKFSFSQINEISSKLHVNFKHLVGNGNLISLAIIIIFFKINSSNLERCIFYLIFILFIYGGHYVSLFMYMYAYHLCNFRYLIEYTFELLFQFSPWSECSSSFCSSSTATPPAAAIPSLSRLPAPLVRV